MPRSQIVQTKRVIMDVPIEGDFYTAHDFNWFSPFEFLLGYYWQLPYETRRQMIKNLATAMDRGEYEPVLEGVENVVKEHADNLLGDLEQAIIERTKESTGLRAANLLTYKEDTLFEPPDDPAGFTPNPKLRNAKAKKYLEQLEWRVKSITHSNIRGGIRTVRIDANRINQFQLGDIDFFIDDFQYSEAKISSQKRHGTRKRTVNNHLFTRYGAAAFGRYASVMGLDGTSEKRDSILPFNPLLTPHLLAEAIALYYLGKGILEAKQYAIDLQLFFKKGFVAAALHDKMEQGLARRMVQRHDLKYVSSEEHAIVDQMLKNAYIRLLKDKGYEWIGYDIVFPWTGIEATGERWISNKWDMTLVSGEFASGELMPPLILRRRNEKLEPSGWSTKKSVFDPYATQRNLPTYLDRSSLSNKFRAEWRGPLYDVSTGFYVLTYVSPPDLTRLPLTPEERNRIAKSIEERVGNFTNY